MFADKSEILGRERRGTGDTGEYGVLVSSFPAIPASLMAASCESSSGLPVYCSASSRLCGGPAAAVVFLPHRLRFLLIANQSKARATRKDTAGPRAMPAMAPEDSL